MNAHPSHRLWAEAVRIAYHLHWSLDSILDLEHPDRRRVLVEIDLVRDMSGRRIDGTS
jgi:hypothetical protein